MLRINSRGRLYRILSVGAAMSLPLAGTTAFAQTPARTLTATQMTQAAQIARNTEQILTPARGT